MLNFYARTAGPVVIAKNGVIYLLAAPLLPPAPPLTGLFLVPSVFSTLTSGVQKVDLDLHTFHRTDVATDDDAQQHVVSELFQELVEDFKLTQYTIFAPTNGVCLFLTVNVGWH